MRVASWIQGHSRSILFLLALLAAGGIVAALRLPVSMFPTVDFPRVVVSLDAGDRPADQMALQITTPVEEAIRRVIGGYRRPWKPCANTSERNSEALLNELQHKLMAPHHEWQEIRALICPECGIMHDVEAPVPWYPILNEFEPDIETFYREWVKLPLPEKAN